MFCALSRAVSPTFDSMMRTSGRATTPHLSVTVVALATLAWVVLLLSSTAEPRRRSSCRTSGWSCPRWRPAWRRSAAPGSPPGATRRFWFLLGAAAGSWGCGQAVWTWYESILGREVPFPSPADIGYLGMPVLATAALLSLPLAAPTLAGRARTILDGLTVAASLLVCSWVLVLEPRVPRRQRRTAPRAGHLAGLPRRRHRAHHDRDLHGAAGASPRRFPVGVAAPGRHRSGRLRRRGLRLQLPRPPWVPTARATASTSAGSSATP